MMQDYLFFAGINILLAWSVYIILMSGSLSFANGGFMAVGAYASGLMTTRYGWDLWLAIPASAALAGLFGALISLPALRTRGVYLILVTIGVSFCMVVAIESTELLGGVQGLGGLVGTEPWHVGALVLAVGACLWLVSYTPLQRILDAVREDEHVAGALGVNATYVKVVTFGVGAALAAAAGALYGHYLIFIRPEHFNIMISLFMVLYVILGGVNNLWGAALGAALMTLVPEFIRVLAEWRPTVFGVLIVLLLLVRPEGILAFRTVTARAGKRIRKEGAP
ncbi:MAG: branched-chain amino acid abc transporter, permease protein [Hyphomicrobiales bacterium]|nr:branched-chain amino acid abc transporter, permease protein [Hyphomicrobiales bacterium]